MSGLPKHDYADCTGQTGNNLAHHPAQHEDKKHILKESEQKH